MAPMYAPQLTAYRAVLGGVDCHCVEHNGTVFAVGPRGDRMKEIPVDDGSGGAVHEGVEIKGKWFTLSDETEVVARDGGVLRCVDYIGRGGETVLRLTVTENNELAEVVGPNDELRALGCGEDCFEKATGTLEYFVDAEGEDGAFVLLVSVRQKDRRIVCMQRLN